MRRGDDYFAAASALAAFRRASQAARERQSFVPAGRWLSRPHFEQGTVAGFVAFGFAAIVVVVVFFAVFMVMLGSPFVPGEVAGTSSIIDARALRLMPRCLPAAASKRCASRGEKFDDLTDDLTDGL